MAINIIERAIVPYNRSGDKIVQKQGYSLYAPVADIGKVGMAAFSGDDFNVTSQTVSLKYKTMHYRENARAEINAKSQYNFNLSVSDTKYLMKLVLVSNEFPLTTPATLYIATDTFFDVHTTPGLEGNDFWYLLSEDCYFADFTREQLLCIRLIDGIFYVATIEPVSDREYDVTVNMLHDVYVVEQKMISRAGSSGIISETDPTVPAWAKSSTKPTYKVSEIEGAATQSTVDDLKKVAIGIPTYDVLTGIMTFKTLDNGTTKAVDLPIEKIVDNVTLSEDGKSFVFTFHNSAPITLPIGNITLPAWVTTEEFETATGDKLLIPPNTEAVRNYIIAKLSNETSLRQTADNAIKAAAIGTPTLSGQELIFPNLNGSELKRITLPSGENSSGGYSHLPLQRGSSYSLQEVAPKVYRARVWKDVDDIYCSYGRTTLGYMLCSNWQQLLPTYAERSKLRISIATVPIHETYDVSTGTANARDVSVSFHKDAGRIDFYGNPDDTGDDYYIPSHDWYVEIEVDLNQNQCVIKAFQCDNY